MQRETSPCFYVCWVCQSSSAVRKSVPLILNPRCSAPTPRSVTRETLLSPTSAPSRSQFRHRLPKERSWQKLSTPVAQGLSQPRPITRGGFLLVFGRELRQTNLPGRN